jgi:DNA-directed RNA polymerase subunit K/omega
MPAPLVVLEAQRAREMRAQDRTPVANSVRVHKHLIAPEAWFANSFI